MNFKQLFKEILALNWIKSYCYVQNVQFHKENSQKKQTIIKAPTKQQSCREINIDTWRQKLYEHRDIIFFLRPLQLGNWKSYKNSLISLSSLPPRTDC